MKANFLNCKHILTIAVAVCMALPSLAKEKNDVTVMVERKVQPTIYGMNFVDEFSRKMYRYILNGNITLYENSSKKVIIKPSSLLNFEKKTRNVFNQTHEIWLYEEWVNNSEGIKCNTKGLSFVSRGEAIDVMFGYVDYADVERLVKNYYPNVDANGYATITLLQSIKAKLFSSRVSKFNNRIVHTKGASKDLMFKFMQTPETNTEISTLKKVKKIQYSVNLNYGQTLCEENEMLRNIENYFKSNPQELMNIGGEEFANNLTATTSLPSSEFKVTSLIVTEDWEMDKNKQTVVLKPVSVAIVINNKVTLSAISIRQINKWNLNDDVYNYALDFFKNKNYSFKTIKINNQSVDEAKSEDRVLINNLTSSSYWL